MLNLLSGITRDCQAVRRRHFLQVGTLAGLGLSLPELLAGRRAAAATSRASAEVNCILIWTQGGTSHHDTFDPKPEAPASVRGPYQAIDTAVPGVKFTEVVPRLAKELPRFSILRSWNPRNGSHGTADQYVMSGATTGRRPVLFWQRERVCPAARSSGGPTAKGATPPPTNTSPKIWQRRFTPSWAFPST
ncbi:MAG TPA: DUF1501 domain-containing protein [Pirellulales bacterium]|nr:DUF1501 domain-containing protein [Pirellulales bacterium]